jgi:hypothetical protein
MTWEYLQWYEFQLYLIYEVHVQNERSHKIAHSRGLEVLSHQSG